jgi:hypothetical protein
VVAAISVKRVFDRDVANVAEIPVGITGMGVTLLTLVFGIEPAEQVPQQSDPPFGKGSPPCGLPHGQAVGLSAR